MQRDIFTPTNKDKNNSDDIQKDFNFFLQPQQMILHKQLREQSRSLNDYDMNILEEDAYKDVKDEVFKLEYKINRLENSIDMLNKKIIAAEEIGDSSTIEKLNTQKSQIEAEMQELNDVYKEISLSAKITGGVTGELIKKIKSNNNLKNFIEGIISILPERISSLIKIKHSLEKLENINKNVDELITMQIPYGEASDRYNKLSKYIIKANYIQSEISKHIK